MIITKDNYSVYEENGNFRIAVFSSIGERNEQQDSAGYILNEDGGIVVLCDGMGGHEGGKIISTTTTQLILNRFQSENRDFYDDEFLTNLLKGLDFHITSLKREDGSPVRGGTTCVIVILKEKRCRWFSVGDSRLYLLRNGEMKQLSEDHTYQKRLDRMYSDNQISEEEYKLESERKGEMLISFLGVGELNEISFGKTPLSLLSGDGLLIASDGLYKYIQEDNIPGILNNFSNEEDALRALEAKVKKSNSDSDKRRDNMTLALIRVK